MKAILEFNLPEERDDFETASNADKWRRIVAELDAELRKAVKYSEKKDWPDAERIREMLYELLADENLGL